MRSSSWYQANPRRKKWSFLLPLAVTMVFCAEILFMTRLDMAKNLDVVENWTTSFFLPSSLDGDAPVEVLDDVVDGGDGTSEMEMRDCEKWLEREDAVPYARDFDKDPILVTGKSKDFGSCSVPCEFGYSANRKADATFGYAESGSVPSILRSMESSHYYTENDPDIARRKGFDVVMTTRLSSDVPVGYFSWAEYDIMAPVQPKTEKALAAAFISNCGARNFRLQALEKLEQAGIAIDSYGGCHNNRNGNVDKVETLKRYKFSLAFENSNEEDYVTEKFFQSLVAGTIPVVVGAPNTLDFAPYPGSVLHIKELKDVESAAKTMKHLASDPDAFNQTIRWKYEGPSDSFKALVDMAAVHSSCRLCIFLATNIHKKEESSEKFQKRPCSCSRNHVTTYHFFVTERGCFKSESIFLRSGSLTLKALELAVFEKFKSLNHVPVWKNERPPSLRGGDELKVYKIYPVGLTQRQALYNFRFKDDFELEKYIKENPCAKLEDTLHLVVFFCFIKRFMYLEANTNPAKEIDGELSKQPSKGPLVHEDEVERGQRSTGSIVFIILIISLFVFIVGPYELYLDQKKTLLHKFYWFDIPEGLGLSSFWFLWRATHEVDEIREFFDALCFSATMALMCDFFTNHRFRKMHGPLWIHVYGVIVEMVLVYNFVCIVVTVYYCKRQTLLERIVEEALGATPRKYTKGKQGLDVEKGKASGP